MVTSFPESESDVSSLILSSLSSNSTLKVVGHGHSWSQIAKTEGTVVSLDRMDKIVAFDEGKQIVTAMAGARLDKLLDYLHVQIRISHSFLSIIENDNARIEFCMGEEWNLGGGGKKSTRQKL